jgi:2-iminobutanoate/2-iminopropanoate deaminase
MSERRELRVEGTAPPISHYADAVLAGGVLYVSGILGADPDGTPVDGGVVAQAERIFEVMGQILAAAGATPADVAKVTVYLTDVDDRTKVNPVRQRFFGASRPASTLVEVSRLAVPGALIEVEAVAHPAPGRGP